MRELEGPGPICGHLDAARLFFKARTKYIKRCFLVIIVLHFKSHVSTTDGVSPAPLWSLLRHVSPASPRPAPQVSWVARLPAGRFLYAFLQLVIGKSRKICHFCRFSECLAANAWIPCLAVPSRTLNRHHKEDVLSEPRGKIAHNRSTSLILSLHNQCATSCPSHALNAHS